MVSPAATDVLYAGKMPATRQKGGQDGCDTECWVVACGGMTDWCYLTGIEALPGAGENLLYLGEGICHNRCFTCSLRSKRDWVAYV